MKKTKALKIKILFYNNTTYKTTKTIYKKIAKHVLSAVNYKLDEAEISVVLANDDFIKHLNYKYKKVDKSTDVLSFPMNESDSISDPLLGDIVISVNTAENQANELGHSLNYELNFLFIHGLLHLLGFHHEVSKDMEKKMFSLQTQLIEECSKGGI
jgi:probable rRNA maturation factor